MLHSCSLSFELLLLQNSNVPERLSQLALLFAVLTLHILLLTLQLLYFDAKIVV
jgi:hypothetical protein